MVVKILTDDGSGDVLLTCRATGATGKITAGGAASYTITVCKTCDDLDNAGTDTTIDNMVDVTVQWNVASTSRSLTTRTATIMLV